jgi:exopolysaccharide production protein ExoQ
MTANLSPWSSPAGGLVMAAAALPACALLASRGVVLVLAASALFSLWRFTTSRTLGDIWRGSLPPFAGLVLVWALVTLAWTLDPAAALSKWATVTGILVAALALCAASRDAAQTARDAIGTALIGGFLLGIAVLSIDLVWDQCLSGTLRTILSPGSAPLAPEAVNQGACMLAIWIWPVALTLWHRQQPFWAAAAIVVTAGLVFATPSTSAGFAIIVGVLGGISVWTGGARVARGIGMGLAGLTLLAPIFPVTVANPERLSPYLSATALPELHRLHLWEFVADSIFQHPFSGWGFFASRFMPGGTTELIPGVPLMALHPHNAALQAWLELGVPGALMMAGGLYFVGSRLACPNLDRFTQSGLMATALATLSVASLSYGLWQSWWLSALSLTGAIAICLHSGGKSGQN